VKAVGPPGATEGRCEFPVRRAERLAAGFAVVIGVAAEKSDRGIWEWVSLSVLLFFAPPEE